MKKLLLLGIVLSLSLGLKAQNYVSTTPENKKAILEEFTGTGCPNCPGGHTMAANLLIANPGTVFVVAYHPTNSSYTTTDPMKNAYPNAFYTNPFISPTNRFMPSAMINRRVWSGVERIQSTTSWTADVATIKGEPSPLNLGLSSSYDAVSKMLSVTVEVYMTADVTDALTLYTELTEDGIIASQSGGTANYVHNHVFRAAMPQPSPAQWGEPITTATTQGSLYTATFTYDNTTTNYNMGECELVAFVRNAATEEIVSGNGAKVGFATGVADNLQETASFSVFPNPVTETTTVRFNLEESSAVFYQICDMLGNIVVSGNKSYMSAGAQQFNIHTADLASGMYMLTITSGSNTQSVKIIK
jgi:hypothetical protein